MSKLGFSEQDPFSPARCRKRAMDALARREHSRAELATKLTDHGFAPDTVTSTLDRLGDENLQSDARFAEAFVASRHRQGKGPTRIRAELNQRGLTQAEVDAAIRDAPFDWFALARRVRLQKFGDGEPADFAERARQLRFLTYRGFDAEQSRAAFADGDDDGQSGW